MASMTDLLRDWLDRADARAMPRLYAAVSVETDEVRALLRRRRKPFVDPESPGARREDVHATARWIVEQSRARSGAMAGFAGLLGAVSVPPEVLAHTVALLRMGQRLTVTYGFELGTDRGQMALWRALAAGFQVELPEQGALDVRASHMPGMILRGQSDTAAEQLAGAIVRRSAWMVGTRLFRLVPVLATGVSAMSAHDRTQGVGDRMIAVLQRLAEAPLHGDTEVVDAFEIR